jgi:hypothetical protein
MFFKIFFFLLFSFSLFSNESTPFYWESIHVDIRVLENGDFLVTEIQNYQFQEMYTNERFRYIPLDKVYKIKDISVEENGKALKIQTGIKSNQTWIQWRHALNPPESHEFVIRYRVMGGIQNNKDIDMLYWKAIFSDRKAVVKKASVRVVLPEVLNKKVFSYRNFGAKATANEISPTEYEFYSSSKLNPKEELEIQITFPSGILGNFFK